MRTVIWNQLTPLEKDALIRRPAVSASGSIKTTVDSIIADVRERGDEALFALSRHYDCVDLSSLRINPSAIEEAYRHVGADDVRAIRRAHTQILRFHQRQLPESFECETSPGIICGRRAVPIERVGLYVPGGTAPLISTVLMLATPAEIAGCPTKVLVTPPGKDGRVNPYIIVAADLCGINDIFALGGAQAIAALAYGTESVTKVDKIFGPGNSYVTAAKLAVSEDPEGAAIDMPAGPSEVLVVADDSTDATFAAADLLSQAEHGIDSQVMLVVTSRSVAQNIEAEITSQLSTLPRADIARSALENSFVILADEEGTVLEIVNRYAPEHLILLQRDARRFANQVKNAGSIFIGPWAPESVGDYASGTNHVLPTYGYARNYSGLGTESFMKFITYQELTPAGIIDIGPVVQALSSLEGLHGHRNAVSVRLRRLLGGTNPCV
jgi:histidinol dehydrogenase